MRSQEASPDQKEIVYSEAHKPDLTNRSSDQNELSHDQCHLRESGWNALRTKKQTCEVGKKTGKKDVKG